MHYGENVKFMVGHTFQSEYGTHEYGTDFKEWDKIQNLDVLVSAGWLYPYVPDQGYAQLPAHLFTYVQTKQEALDRLRGDTTPYAATQHPGGKPEVVEQAEREAEMQPVARKLALRTAAEQAKNTPPAQIPKAPLQEPESSSLEDKVQRTVAKKAAARKTPAKKTAAKKTDSSTKEG